MERKKEEVKKTIEVTIKVVSYEEELKHNFPLDSLISDIKTYIQLHHSEHFSKNHQRLFYKGKELSNEDTLKSIFKGRAIPLEVILILLFSLPFDKSEEELKNTLLVCVHVFNCRSKD